jgi:hypothetical protein
MRHAPTAPRFAFLLLAAGTASIGALLLDSTARPLIAGMRALAALAFVVIAMKVFTRRT